jgi:hypothetical protein
VVDAGLAITLELMEELSDDDGLQEYAVAPEAISTVFCPMHTVTLGETVTMGRGFTVTVTCAVAVHPFRLPVTV